MTPWNEDVGSCQGGIGRYEVLARNNSIGREETNKGTPAFDSCWFSLLEEKSLHSQGSCCTNRIVCWWATGVKGWYAANGGWWVQPILAYRHYFQQEHHISWVALIYNKPLCLPHDIVFSTRNAVDRTKTMFSSNHITSYQLMSEVNIKDRVKETAKSIFDLSSVSAINTSVLQLVGKFGVDGYGSHKIRHQLIDPALALTEIAHFNLEKTNSFLLSCYCPLELLAEDCTLLCSRSRTARFAGPITLTRSPEDGDVLAVELAPSFQIIRDFLQMWINNRW